MADRTPWVVINANHGGRFECRRCGAYYGMKMPAPVDIVIAASKAFETSHRRCSLKPEGLHCAFCTETGHDDLACPTLKVATYEEWWNGHDRGMSSMTIWGVMAGKLGRVPPWEQRPPSDPSDFARCSRLLALFPEWRPRMGEMSQLAGWEPFAEAWEELEALFAEEVAEGTGSAPRLFARMRALEGR